MEAAYLYVLGVVAAIGAAGWWKSFTAQSPIDPFPTILPHPPLRTGVYAPNAHLRHHLSRLAEGLLPHPEDLVASPDGLFLYVSCSDGWIKQLHLPSGRVHNWSHVSGGHRRPLGLAAGLQGEILACEASLGLLNITEGNVEVLTDNACGIKFKFADGVDVSKEDGLIYFTDASTKFGFGESDFDVLEGRPNGRLLHYDPSTGATTVAATGLYFPNGVAISSDQSFLVFCETAKVRCQRMWLKGSRKGEMEIFIDNLPGFPDNIHATRRGTFWIGLVSGRSLWTETLLSFSFLKHFFATPQGIKSLDVAAHMAKVLEVSKDGKPLRFFEDPDGKSMGFVTTALEVGETLYLGGLASDYIGMVPLTQGLS